jgi:glutaconate CoA-transferase subunit B
MSKTSESYYTPAELMTVSVARHFKNGATCFIGVGMPGLAACVARRCHAPDCILIYESGTVGAKPSFPPLSIADNELARTADFLVSIPEMFTYWLQGGRVDLAILGAAQIDRFANLNTTVIGDYDSPSVRLPGAGGAPEIARHAREVLVVVRQTGRAFVEQLDFLTSPGQRVSAVVTDLGILKPDAETRELTLSSKHPGTTVAEIQAATGWPLRIADDLVETVPPSESELNHLRELEGRARKAA